MLMRWACCRGSRGFWAKPSLLREDMEEYLVIRRISCTIAAAGVTSVQPLGHDEMSTTQTEAETRRTDHQRWPKEDEKQNGANEKGKGEGRSFPLREGGGGSHTRGCGQVSMSL
jgi:hypothetical protein